jgi:hypothetical protein
MHLRSSTRQATDRISPATRKVVRANTHGRSSKMFHPVYGIDHCVALTHDLDSAAEKYRAMGFTLSPRGTHSKAKGSANYTIMFPHDYFELLGFLAATEVNAPRREMLATMGEGLHAISCRIENVEDAGNSLADLGIETQELNSFSRPVPRPDGSEEVASFSTLTFSPSEVPFGSVFMCEHKTPDAVWMPELLNHPNGACGLDAVLAISDTPEQDALTFARLWAHGSVSESGGCYNITTGTNSAALMLFTKEKLAKLFPDADFESTARGAFAGIRIKTSNTERLKTFLTKSQIPYSVGLGGVYLCPQNTSGILLQFV